MKVRVSVFALLLFFLSSLSGCVPARPEHLPGIKEEDVQLIWVCKEPFSYFAVDKEELSTGYPCLKGYIIKEKEALCFYMHEELNTISCFVEEELWDSTTSRDAFRGHTKYYEDYFVFEVEHDLINFFGEELPTLRFEKMTKEAFLQEFGEVENISELLD